MLVHSSGIDVSTSALRFLSARLGPTAGNAGLATERHEPQHPERHKAAVHRPMTIRTRSCR
ncbi:hypothetical protein [Streptomyces iranensis]|uniref:Uncharacterized protein n=1 Tax=Streptomyces iranensis TaxID=576784 RepID=A0ABS4MRK0_9ACTN|nr:hypothetical protein [Streptomyces iranensis]MBP2062351.1 hypothetical protein [Streptomyces iranensis]